jgi:hypothetical protein
MDYKERFLAIKKFLNEHQYLHELELLERSKDELSTPYHQWALELSKLELNDLLKLERDFETQRLANFDLIHFVKEAQRLSEVATLKLASSKLSPFIERKLTPKKIHEIQKLVTLVDQKFTHKNIIDFGSGMGHLSMALTCHHHRTSVCVDMDANLQKKGQEKIQRWLPELKNKMQFIQSKILNAHDFPVDVKNPETLLIGLHACGPLSTLLVQSSPTHLISIACCYHKLNREYNLSKISQKNPLWFSGHALTLAAKCLGTQTENDLQLKWQVKRYRYALHFLLQQEGQSFVSLGNAHASDYHNDFAHYGKKYAPELNKFSDQFLNDFFANDKTQEKLQYFFKAGTLRAMLGRLIELYINLDRLLYLQEQAKEAQLFKIFDDSISPRNLAIVF